jgi:hypothetical protein
LCTGTSIEVSGVISPPAEMTTSRTRLLFSVQATKNELPSEAMS